MNNYPCDERWKEELAVVVLFCSRRVRRRLWLLLLAR